MDKKIALIICAVIAFFAGQIFLDEALAAAGVTSKTFAEFLVPVFELVVGGVLGYFYKKFEDERLIDDYRDRCNNLTNQLYSMSASTDKTNASKSTKKNTNKVS